MNPLIILTAKPYILSKLFYLALIFHLVFLGCSIKIGGSDKENSEIATAVPITIQTVTRGDISTYLRLNSTLQANREVDVFAQVVAKVIELKVEEGDKVTEGDLLAKLEDAEQNLNIEKATATVKKEQVTLARLEKLYLHESKMISDDDYEMAKLSLRQAELALQEAELALEYTFIRAPFGGTIAERLIDLGDRVNLTEPPFKIVDFDILHIDAWIAESDVPKLSLGQTASVLSDKRSDPIIAKLIRLSPVVDQTYGKVKATFELRNLSGNIRPGQFVELSLTLNTNHNSILIPKRALVHEAGKPTVYVVQDTLAHRRRVTTGIETGEVIEILAGLAVGDRVIIEGQATLRDSTHIQVIPTLDTPTQ